MFDFHSHKVEYNKQTNKANIYIADRQFDNLLSRNKSYIEKDIEEKLFLEHYFGYQMTYSQSKPRSIYKFH